MVAVLSSCLSLASAVPFGLPFALAYAPEASPIEQIADELGANGLPYALPIHPNLVHLTIGLFVIAIAFDVVGALYPLEKRVFRFLALPITRGGFHDVGWYNLLACCLVTYLTVAVGFYEMLTAVPLPGVTSTFGLGSNTFSGNAYWVEQGTQFLGATAPGIEVGPLHLFKVILNGQDRFKEQYGNYFNQVQPFYHHTGTPYPGIYVYSFALQPEEHQPTGTCNFSRIDNAQVSVQMKSNNSATLQKLFAVNYNILRIQSGMGGLAFSN